MKIFTKNKHAVASSEFEQIKQYLLTQQAVTQVLAESSTLKDAAPKVLQTICENLNYELGECWIIDPKDNVLHFGAMWCKKTLPTEEWLAANEKLTFATGIGLPGNVWSKKQPIWIADLSVDSSVFTRKDLAAKFDLDHVFSFPIIYESQILGTLEFFGKNSQLPGKIFPDKKLLIQTFLSLGSQFGTFIIHEKAERALQDNEAKYRQLIEASPYGICIQIGGKIIFANTALAKMLGTSNPHMLIGKSLSNFVYPYNQTNTQEQINQFNNELKEQVNQEYRMISLDGTNIDVEIIGKEFLYLNKLATQIMVHDITRRKQVETELVYLASHDPLTGLANRVKLEAFINQSIISARIHKDKLAILFLDLDRFKDINDTLGHEVGDKLLQVVAERLHKQIRTGDVIARLGGDEFVIILQNVKDDDMVITVAQKILDSFIEDFVVGTRDFSITTSIGISLYPNDGENSQALLKSADIALYKAKEMGRNNYQFCTVELTTETNTRVSLENALRSALTENEMFLYYQPKIELKTNRIIGVEAVLRWLRKDGTMQSPAEFIPLAEDTGLIIAIGEWVLETACKQHKAWEKMGILIPNISVNLSARQIREVNIGEIIKRILVATEVDPHYLELELTETVLIREATHITSTLKELKDLGILLSIDDFGIGYSSLSYLKRFTINRLKIDQSFIAGMGKDSNSAAIILAIIAMSHSLGIKVIAEGVETKEQLDFLTEHNCDEVQGFYISKPLPADKITQFLRKGLQT